MRLHTRDAMRLFLGRSVKPGEGGYPMAGGKCVAAALRALWSLSANDNPYADCALIEVTERVVALRQQVESDQRDIVAQLEAMKSKGLDYAILQSREPAELTLGFVSPYGYMVALLLVEFDYLVRVIKSATLRDLIGSDMGRQQIRLFKHRCLSIFHFAVRWQLVLSRPAFMTLRRAEFLPDATDEAKARIQDVRTLLALLRSPPSSNTSSTVSPSCTLAVFLTAPNPVVTPQPSKQTCSGFASGLIFASETSATTVYSLNVEQPM
jgi:integrating conjugative element protein (TIGR03761 family)